MDEELYEEFGIVPEDEREACQVCGYVDEYGLVTIQTSEGPKCVCGDCEYESKNKTKGVV